MKTPIFIYSTIGKYFSILNLFALLMLASCSKPKTYIRANEAIFYLKNNDITSINTLRTSFSDTLGIPINNISIQECKCDKKLIKIVAPGIENLLFHGVAKIPGQPTGGVGNDLMAQFSSISNNIKSYEPNIIFEAPEVLRTGGPDSQADNIEKQELAKNSNYVFDSMAPKFTKIAIIDAGIGDFYKLKNYVVNGYNFIGNDNDLSDMGNPHGHNVVTFMLDELAKRNVKNIQIIPLKVLNEKNQADYFNVLCALLYAYQHDAEIINLSLGYYGQNSDLLKKILVASNFSNPNDASNSPYKNKWIVAAAGNKDTQADGLEDKSFHHRNLDKRKNKFYPVYYASELDSLIGITSASSSVSVAENQNYSEKSVDVAVKTDTELYFTDGTNSFTGSSYAAPIFTAYLAELIKNGTLITNKSTLLNSASEITKSSSLKTQIKEGRIISRKKMNP